MLLQRDTNISVSMISYPEGTLPSPWRSEISRMWNVNLQSKWWAENNLKLKISWLSRQPETRLPRRVHLFTTAFTNIYTWAVNTCVNIHIYIYMYLKKLSPTYVHICVYIYLYTCTYIKYIEPHYVLSVYMHKHKTYQLVYTHGLTWILTCLILCSFIHNQPI